MSAYTSTPPHAFSTSMRTWIYSYISETAYSMHFNKPGSVQTNKFILKCLYSGPVSPLTHHTIIFLSHDNGIVQLLFAQYKFSRIILTVSLLLGTLFKLGDNENNHTLTTMTWLTNISPGFEQLEFLTEDTSWRWYGALVHKKWHVTGHNSDATHFSIPKGSTFSLSTIFHDSPFTFLPYFRELNLFWHLAGWDSWLVWVNLEVMPMPT